MTTRSPLSRYVQIDTSSARVARVWIRVSERLRLVTPQRRWPNFAVAGLLLCVAALALVFWRRTSTLSDVAVLPSATMETSSDVMKLALGEGATLELAALTRLELLSSEPRAMAFRLRGGVVSCAFLPGSFRRFSIFVADLEVRVTGTEFQVHQDAKTNRVEVNVTRGSVVVYGPGELAHGRVLADGERWSAKRDLPHATDFQTGGSAGADGGPSLPNLAPFGSVVGSAGVGFDAPEGNGQNSRSMTSPVADSSTGSLARLSPPRTPNRNQREDASSEVDTASEWFERANTARRAGDLSGAARAYQTLLSRFPDDAHADLAAFELGRLRLTALGDVSGAIRALKVAVARTHNQTLLEDAMWRLMEAYAKSGQWVECRAMRSNYLNTFSKGVHAAAVDRYCSER